MPRLKRPLLIASLSLALLGVASGRAPLAAPQEAASAPSAAPAAAPVPPPAPPAAEVLALRGDLERLVRDAGPGARVSVLVVSLDRGDTLFSHLPDLSLVPASNLKLYSTAAALYYLGPDFRYSTYVLGTGEVEEGVLTGDLVLYGTGDPSISGRLLESSLSTFREMADSVAAQGIREVRGAVVGDGSYFDSAWIGDGWEEDDRMSWYAAPVGALSFAENVVSVRVLPGGAAGEPARIRTTPQTEGLAVENRVRTVASGATRIRFEQGADGLVVEGQIARRHPGLARSLPVVDPGNFAAAAFRAVLEERGIRVAGGVRSVRDAGSSAVALAAGSAAPAEEPAPPRVLAVHLSPTLAELTRLTNHISHNLFAEAMLKAVGRVALGDGSFAGGGRAVRYFLECEANVDSASLHIVDGSGLSNLNRVTARTTVQLLDYMRRSGVGETFYASLPEAATRNDLAHSLRNRMGGTAAAGNLRAKTGTIQHVSSLSGYVRAADGENLAFSIIANGVPSTWRAKRAEDAIGARIARFSRPEAAPQLGEPLPTALAAPDRSPEAAPAPAASPAPARSAPAPKPAPAARTHRVKSGDTLDGIARRYDTSVRELQRLNPGLDPRRLQIGQRVRVPGE